MKDWSLNSLRVKAATGMQVFVVSDLHGYIVRCLH